jgi:hypothetical protein
MVTVPEVMAWAAEVVLVNAPKVPSPAIDADAPSAATLPRITFRRDLRVACRPRAMGWPPISA